MISPGSEALSPLIRTWSSGSGLPPLALNVIVTRWLTASFCQIGYKVILGDDKYSNYNYSNYLKDEKSEIIGEEARLLYVAMTRCKKNLYLNSSGLSSTEGINNWKSLIGGARTYV